MSPIAYTPEGHGILSGDAIIRCVEGGAINISPFNPKQVNEASYDMTLGENVRVYEDVNVFSKKDPNRPDGSEIYPAGSVHTGYLDSKKPNKTVSFKIGPNGWLLRPGIGYLMHVNETISTDHYVPVIDGKSSIGRLFILVHYTAGYVDPGFKGQYTLEVSAQHPTVVYAGQRIGQLRFHTIAGKPILYSGRYKDETAVGAVSSHAFEQFNDEKQPMRV